MTDLLKFLAVAVIAAVLIALILSPAFRSLIFQRRTKRIEKYDKHAGKKHLKNSDSTMMWGKSRK